MEKNVIDAIILIKPKNCEGYDQIPQRILLDGVQYLLKPLAQLFNQIYLTKTNIEQWMILKIMPIINKSSPNQIENYQPKANLCSASKCLKN